MHHRSTRNSQARHERAKHIAGAPRTGHLTNARAARPSFVCCSYRYPLPITSSYAVPYRGEFFEDVLALLRDLLPPERPVIVRRGLKLTNVDGDCLRTACRFRIRISRELPDRFAADVLLHEWAHAMAWDDALSRAVKRCRTDLEFQRLAHGRKWGIAYSRVYSTFITDILPELQG